MQMLSFYPNPKRWYVEPQQPTMCVPSYCRMKCITGFRHPVPARPNQGYLERSHISSAAKQQRRRMKLVWILGQGSYACVEKPRLYTISNWTSFTSTYSSRWIMQARGRYALTGDKRPFLPLHVEAQSIWICQYLYIEAM